MEEAGQYIRASRRVHNCETHKIVLKR